MTHPDASVRGVASFGEALGHKGRAIEAFRSRGEDTLNEFARAELFSAHSGFGARP